MLASLNYKLHLYFKSHYAKSTTTSDLMILNMASTFRNNELALFVFARYYFANLLEERETDSTTFIKKITFH